MADRSLSAVAALAARIVPWQVRNGRRVLAVALLLTAVGGFFAALLYSDLRSGVEELLPENAPSVLALREVAPRLNSISHLSVVVEGSEPDALTRFADDLVKRLRDLPPGLIDQIEYRTDEDDAFLKRYGLLYATVEDLETARDRVKARITWERRQALGGLTLDEGGDTPPTVDFADLEARHADARAARARFRNGYFQTPEGTLLVVRLRPPETSTSLGANDRLLQAVRDQVAALNPASYDATMRVGYCGDVAELVEEQAALKADILLSSVVVLVLVLGSLYLYFRRWAAIAALMLPLTVACAVTFGISFFLVGHLNGNTAFLGSIVVGNGINVGIIYLARYLEARRAGDSVEIAQAVAWGGTLAPTFVAAFAAGLAYLSLASTNFRGFSQFGYIGFCGMAACWLATYVLMPPVLAWLEGRSPIDAGPAPSEHAGFGRLTTLVLRFPGALRLASIGLVAACGVAVATYKGGIFETDMTQLRSAESTRTGAMYWSDKADEVFKAYLTPLVIWAETPEALDRVVVALEKRRAALGDKDPLREVQTRHTFVPEQQAEKLALIEEIRGFLTPSRVRKLAPDVREKLDAAGLLSTDPLQPVTIDALPTAWRRGMVEKDGTVGRIAAAFPRKIGRLDLDEALVLKTLALGAIADVGVEAYAWNPLMLLSDIEDAIAADGPRATALAFAGVCLLVGVVLRRVGATVAVIAALLLGLAGLVGAAAAFGVRLNFLNFVVLPITCGIGVDYGVNIVQRWLQEGPETLGRVLRETGGAVALCSATTIIGYGSLVVADSRALSGFGVLAVGGEVACLLAAVFLLPAWLAKPGGPVQAGGRVRG